ncbi:hypothetical protein ACFTAO_35710 [Paenibacillus rhizoplanae]
MKKLTIEDVAQKAGVSKKHSLAIFLNKRFKYMSEATKKTALPRLSMS